MNYYKFGFMAASLVFYCTNATAKDICPALDPDKFMNSLKEMRLDQTQQKRIMKLEGQTWFMPKEDWEQLDQTHTSKMAKLVIETITLEKDDKLSDRVRCFYSARMRPGYSLQEDAPYIDKKFRITYLYN